MVDKAKKLTKDLDGDGKTDQYGLGVEASIIRLAPFVWSNGGEHRRQREEPDSPDAEHAGGPGSAEGVPQAAHGLRGDPG